VTVTEAAGPDRHANPDAVEFFDAASRAFRRAGTRVGVREHDLSVAGERVRLRFAGEALEPLLAPALEHLRMPREPAANTALTISFFDSASTGEPMPAPAWGPLDYGAKGEITGFNDDRIRVTYQPGVDILNMYDAARRVALYWVAAPGVVPWWESSFPLRTILHWWAAPSALQPVHAGAVGFGGRGVLVAGNSGAGKSTTTLACLEAGLDYAGDDFVLVDVESSLVHSLYGTAKLEPGNLERFPALAPLIANAERLEAEKAMVFLREHRPDRLVSTLRLEAIVLTSVTGRRDSGLEVTSPAAVLRVLAPTTSFHLPGYRREVFAKASALARSLPCYRLDAGTDLEQLAATVARLVGS
jgi:hypothetical protein